VTVHGDEATAEEARRRCAEEADRARARFGLCPGLTVADLLAVWLDADHGWRPSTVLGYRSIVRLLAQDPIAGRRAVEVSPVVVRAACVAWREARRAQPTGRLGALPALGVRLGLCGGDPGPQALGRAARPGAARGPAVRCRFSVIN
jgi:hypothetical protein